jgi:GNAT superfamily N-acetyltransferase
MTECFLESELPEGYEICLGTPEDCAALPAIELAAAEMFRPLNLINFDNGPSVLSEDQLRQYCADCLLWVATFDGSPVGFVASVILNGDFYIAELDVHPGHGRMGLGRALLGAACEEAFARGYPRALLNTFRGVPWNAPFYASQGFTEIAEKTWSGWMRALTEKHESDGIPRSTRVFMELRR